MTLPTCVIIGAPKCGTSTLYRWLTAHPEVAGSTPKETFYLMDAGHPLARPDGYHVRGAIGYEACFAGLPPARVVVEATTHYLYQDTARDVLAALPTRPIVLALLREPAGRVLSSFQYTKHVLASVDPRFEFADFAAADEAEVSRRVTSASSAWVLARDRDHSAYVRYLRRYAEAFGDRLQVRLMETMQADPRAFMVELCGVLGIDPTFYARFGFTRHNETRAPRSRLLQRAARALGPRLPEGRLRAALRRGYRAVGLSGRPELTRRDRDALATLRQELADDTRALERELGVDLGPWRRAEQTGLSD